MKKKPFIVPNPKTGAVLRYSIFQLSEKGKLKMPKDTQEYSEYVSNRFNEFYDTPEKAIQAIEEHLNNRYAEMKPYYELAPLVLKEDYIILPVTSFECGDL